MSDLIATIPLSEGGKEFVLDCASAVHIMRLSIISEYQLEARREEDRGYDSAVSAIMASWEAASDSDRRAVVVIGYGALCKAALKYDFDVRFEINGTETALPPIAMINDQIDGGGVLTVTSK